MRVESLVSIEEYLEEEYASKERHEYINGEIIQMSYASENHELIIANLIVNIGMALKGTKSRIYGSNRMLFVPDCGNIYYADAMIVKGETLFQQMSARMQATLNPAVLIEVLSDSNENNDLLHKLQCYKTIPSLQQYLIFSQNEIYVDMFTRTAQDRVWTNTYFDSEEEVIQIAEISLSLKDIYEGIIFKS